MKGGYKLQIQRHQQEVYEVTSAYYSVENKKKLSRASFMLRYKTIVGITKSKITVRQAVNKIFDIDYFKKCRNSDDISKYKKKIRRELVEILNKLDIDVKYNKLSSTRSKKFQAFMNEKMEKYREDSLKKLNYKQFVKTLKEREIYLERNLFNAVLMVINDIRIYKKDKKEAVQEAVKRFDVKGQDVKKYLRLEAEVRKR